MEDALITSKKQEHATQTAVPCTVHTRGVLGAFVRDVACQATRGVQIFGGTARVTGDRALENKLSLATLASR